MPVIVVEVLERACARADGVHQHIERAPRLLHRRVARSNGIRVGHVDVQREDLGGAGTANALSRGVKPGLATRHYGYRCALGAERFRDRQTHTLTAAGDNGVRAGETQIHTVSSTDPW
jgi:hypothetical protein